jgi:hypothetical protein
MDSAIEARVLAAASRGTGGRRQAARAKAVGRLIAWFRTERRIRRAIDEAMSLDDRPPSAIGRPSGNVGRAARNDGSPAANDRPVPAA